MSRTKSVYATFKDQVQAETIARSVVEEGLAACVNIIPKIQSIYRWQGAIQMDTEVAFFAKTTSDQVEALVDRIAQLHSYDTPCILVFDLEGGHQPYLNWLLNPKG